MQATQETIKSDSYVGILVVQDEAGERHAFEESRYRIAEQKQLILSNEEMAVFQWVIPFRYIPLEFIMSVNGVRSERRRIFENAECMDAGVPWNVGVCKVKRSNELVW